MEHRNKPDFCCILVLFNIHYLFLCVARTLDTALLHPFPHLFSQLSYYFSGVNHLLFKCVSSFPPPSFVSQLSGQNYVKQRRYNLGHEFTLRPQMFIINSFIWFGYFNVLCREHPSSQTKCLGFKCDLQVMLPFLDLANRWATRGLIKWRMKAVRSPKICPQVMNPALVHRSIRPSE